MGATVITDPKEMQRTAEAHRAAGRTIAFVPTMGYLHEGHASLLRKGREMADVLVMSIFVNPTQFAPTEDLSAYPRDFERDRVMAEREKTDIIFFPEARDVYPAEYQTEIAVREVSKPLCGVSRPTHFAGVATVCCKLFNMVKPHFAVFGEKDFQQYLVITRMVRDLNMDLEIVPFPTVRESDGLAMSSRNVYLSSEERAQAVWLSRALAEAKKAVENGERNARNILDAVRADLANATLGAIDYVEMRTVPDLSPVRKTVEGPTLLALAVKFGKARLIDNIVLLRAPKDL